MIKMRNGKDFEQAVLTVTLAACLSLLCIVFALIVGGPILLAVKVSPWWLSLYALYAAVFCVAVLVTNAKKAYEEADKYEEDMYEDH